MQMKEALLRALQQRNTTPAQFAKDCKSMKPQPKPKAPKRKPS